jgi:hypothetical protein
MIYTPLSAPMRSREFPLLLNGAGTLPTLAQDGQAMVRGTYGQTFGMTPSAGTSGEVFLGFLFAQLSAVPFLQTTAVKVETFTLASGLAMTLSKIPMASSVFVYNMTTQAGVTLTGADTYSTTTGVVTLGLTGVIGNVYTVTYRYSLSVVEARSRNGDVVAGSYAGLTTGTAAVMVSGTIYTDQFDVTKNWAAATGATVKLAANGQVTDTTGSGTALLSSVIAVPTVDFPFLGIEFSAY